MVYRRTLTASSTRTLRNCHQEFDAEITIYDRIFRRTVRYEMLRIASPLVLQFDYFPALLETICFLPTAGNDVI